VCYGADGSLIISALWCKQTSSLLHSSHNELTELPALEETEREGDKAEQCMSSKLSCNIILVASMQCMKSPHLIHYQIKLWVASLHHIAPSDIQTENSCDLHAVVTKSLEVAVAGEGIALGTSPL